jgi:hypothetical protein
VSNEETSPQVPSAERDKLDEDDHDLLTFNEAGERLRIEIAEARALVEKLEASEDPAALSRARARLDALLEATDRNTAQPINDANFAKFFGYPGKARRNLS